MSFLKKINLNNIPKHIAFIMDGNGRWAKNKGLSRNKGHLEGAKSLEHVINACNILGVKFITFYAFSTENWKRPAKEINNLMKMPEKFFNSLKKKAEKEQADYKVRFIGRRTKVKKEILNMIEQIEKETINNKGMNIIIAFDYGSHEEITNAVKNIIKQGYKEEEITKELIEENLYTKGIPMVDLLVRTSGEQRLSNFLLWQSAYSEFYFEKNNWPEINEEKIYEIVYNYQNRDRKFGGLKE